MVLSRDGLRQRRRSRVSLLDRAEAVEASKCDESDSDDSDELKTEIRSMLSRLAQINKAHKGEESSDDDSSTEESESENENEILDESCPNSAPKRLFFSSMWESAVEALKWGLLFTPFAIAAHSSAIFVACQTGHENIAIWLGMRILGHQCPPKDDSCFL